MGISRLDCSQSQIVGYRGNNQALMNHLLQREFFTYSMQQTQWKKQVQVLVSQNSLSCKAFRAVFPQLAEMTKPNDKSNLIFQLFKHCAENPSEEIGGRLFWSEFEGDYPYRYRDEKVFLDDSMCGVTIEALISAFFGNYKARKLQQLGFKVINKTELEKAWLTIEKNSKLLPAEPSSRFFVYSFCMTPPSKLATSTYYGPSHSHGFLVIQYLDKQGKAQYRFFQSYLRKFCLKDYLDKNSNGLNHQEFMLFLEGLQECLLSDKWTDALEKFYTKHFNTKSGFAIGDTNPCKEGGFGIEWDIASVDDILMQMKKFESYRESPHFPEIEAWH